MKRGVCFTKMGVCFMKVGVRFLKMGVCFFKNGSLFFSKIGVCFLENGSLFYENVSLFSLKMGVCFSENGSLFFRKWEFVFSCVTCSVTCLFPPVACLDRYIYLLHSQATLQLQCSSTETRFSILRLKMVLLFTNWKQLFCRFSVTICTCTFVKQQSAYSVYLLPYAYTGRELPRKLCSFRTENLCQRKSMRYN